MPQYCHIDHICVIGELTDNVFECQWHLVGAQKMSFFHCFILCLSAQQMPSETLKNVTRLPLIMPLTHVAVMFCFVLLFFVLFCFVAGIMWALGSQVRVEIMFPVLTSCWTLSKSLNFSEL